VNPRSTSSAVSFAGAIFFLATALVLGISPYGSAIDAQKNDKSGANSTTLPPQAKGAPSEHQRSNSKSSRPQGLPSPPTNLKATLDSAQVSLTWTDSSVADSYTVLRSTADRGPYQTISSDVPTTSYTDNTVRNGITYFYVVQALKAGVASGNSNQASATLMAPPPTNLEANAANAQVSLTWSATSVADSYTVLRSTTDRGPYRTVSSDISTTSYTDNTVRNGTTYYYVVQAVNGRVLSGNSNQANATPSVETLVPELEQRIDTLRLVAVIAVGAAITSLIFTVLIFLDRKRRVRDSYYEIDSKVAQLKTKVANLANDVDAIRQNTHALRRDLSNFVTFESFEPIRRAFEQRQAERPLAMPNLRPTPPRTQLSDTDGWVQPPPVQVPPIVAVPPAPSPPIKQFADLPDREGNFKEGSLKSKAEWNSLYTLTMLGPDNAIVEIYSGSDRFEAAIKAPDQYLSPVCEYENNPLSSARTIRLVSAGRASREGETWKVTQKLKIEFL
jgi:hypothetical protein